mmetsp:Transcript_4782/g.6056  ORF Transcript_4782/g.6056 Transcript_4782/m.6056 type:complete len:82 (+) Transcript_4782:463-708(+)
MSSHVDKTPLGNPFFIFVVRTRMLIRKLHLLDVQASVNWFLSLTLTYTLLGSSLNKRANLQYSCKKLCLSLKILPGLKRKE